MEHSALAEIGATANSYQVLAKLATGGMAEIFLARSASVASVQRYVVLKRVLRERATDINFIRMFLDEARLAAQLQHPNIAQVFDAGKLGDSYFFTMEYVHGETVRAVLQRAHELHRSPPIGCVLAIAAGAAAGLHHAHERIGMEGRPLGIVHRDVSPSNLMVGYDGSVKVVDFGVAKAADRIHETQSGAVKGKISYLSPEQARGQRLDQRSDLFSLGIVMWEMLTVERLYKHPSDFETMSAIINEPTPPPSSRRRDIPPELDALVLRALAKSPEARFQTAEELAEAIEAVAVQTSSALSAASLSRFVRELFGTRPEPWLALQAKQDRPEVVTVTSEPIPAQLKIMINDPIDQRLSNVIDLSVMPAADDSVLTVTPVTTSDAGSALPTAPRMATVSPSRDPVEPSSRVPTTLQSLRSPVVLISIGVAVACVIALVIAMRGGGLPETTANTKQSSDAASLVAAASVIPDAAELSASPAVDAAELVVQDAATEPTIAPTIADAASVSDPPPSTPPTRARKPPKDRATRISELFAANKLAAVIDECLGSAAAPGPCTRAACQLGNRKLAARWLPRVPASQRARVIKQCRGDGVELEVSSAPRDCEKHPEDCIR